MLQNAGLEREGWFYPTLLIAALKAKLASYGVRFVSGEVVGFNWRYQVMPSLSGTFRKRSQLVHAHVRVADGRVFPIQFAYCVNAAGPQSRSIARLAGIGVGEEALSLDLPIMSRFVGSS